MTKYTLTIEKKNGETISVPIEPFSPDNNYIFNQPCKLCGIYPLISPSLLLPVDNSCLSIKIDQDYFITHESCGIMLKSETAQGVIDLWDYVMLNWDKYKNIYFPGNTK